MSHLRAVPPNTADRTPVEPLWREIVGKFLRSVRNAQRKRLVDVAHKAGISPQYLSEIERGVKEPSSEILAAVAGALSVTLLDVTRHAQHALTTHHARANPTSLTNRRPASHLMAA